MVEGTRSLLKDTILIDPPWALQDPMKQGGSIKLRSGQSHFTDFKSPKAQRSLRRLQMLVKNLASKFSARDFQSTGSNDIQKHATLAIAKI